MGVAQKIILTIAAIFAVLILSQGINSLDTNTQQIAGLVLLGILTVVLLLIWKKNKST
jgi:hypothetical protein